MFRSKEVETETIPANILSSVSRRKQVRPKLMATGFSPQSTKTSDHNYSISFDSQRGENVEKNCIQGNRTRITTKAPKAIEERD